MMRLPSIYFDLIGILLIIEMLQIKSRGESHQRLDPDLRAAGGGSDCVAASTNIVTGINPILALACGLLVAGSVHVVKSAAVRPSSQL